MRLLKSFLPVLLSAAALLACGGGDDTVDFKSTVSFGDSLSDVGTYNVGTVAALGGGRFTVNGTGGKVWTEFLSDLVGTPAQCAARTGMLPNNGVTGAPVVDFAACNNYAQGSSRVSVSGTGPNGVGLQAFGQQNLGFMADSIRDQMNRHLTKLGGAYGGRELITVNGGANDLFMQLSAVSAAVGGGQVAAAGATIAGWEPSVVSTVTAGGSAASNAAANAAVAAMGQAGTELATYIKTLVVAKGGQHVVLRNIGDLNVTPFGGSLDAGTRGLITNLTQAFNAQLAAGVNGTPGVLLLDDYALSTSIAANPASYGYTNITTANCGNNAFGGSSLMCNTGNLIAGITTNYAFSDSVHPTPYSHLKEAENAFALLVGVGWR